MIEPIRKLWSGKARKVFITLAIGLYTIIFCSLLVYFFNLSRPIGVSDSGAQTSVDKFVNNAFYSAEVPMKLLR